MENLIFGPVPSRRLGRSIGINNIPHKHCSYSCAYCQIGKAVTMQDERRNFYSPNILVEQVEKRLKTIRNQDFPDYLTIVPDGEPTLDIHLGKLIVNLKKLGFPVAVITNSSLIHRADVQSELMHADYISFKVDTVDRQTWRKVNKPHKGLNLESFLTSLSNFSKKFEGKLVTETMLIKGLNDTDEELNQLGRFLQSVKPHIAFLAIPTRPPAYKNVFPADELTMAKAYETFSWFCLTPEFLTGYEGNAFASSGNFKNDLLSITAVHPMRSDGVLELMAKSNSSITELNQLIDSKSIKRVDYNYKTYYMRNFTGSNNK